MKNNQQAYILYPYVGTVPEGYTLIHKYTFRDDSLKKKCSVFDKSGDCTLRRAAEIKALEQTDEDYKFYLIKTCDMQKFFSLLTKAEDKYDSDIVRMKQERDDDDEQILTANDKLPRLSNSAIEKLAAFELSKRRPKIRYMRTQPLS